MSENEYKEVVTHSYGENVKNSFGNIVIGIILFVISVMLLWNNEGNLAKQNKIANYITKNAIPVEVTAVDKANNNKLISVAGDATTEATLSDGIITIPNALAMKRTVEMYQWQENKHTDTETKMGGTTTETTTYSYEKVWSDSEIDSSDFHVKSHVNPPFTVKSQRWNAKTGKLGDFNLIETQTSALHHLEDYTNLPQNAKYTISENYYYKASDVANPQIGDIRISYSYLPSGSQISVIGMQRTNKTITPMISKEGRVYLQYDGLLSQDEVVEKYRQGNVFMRNLLRFVGFILMFIGLNIVLKPLSVLLSFIPIFKNIMSAITGGLVLLISAVLSLTIIAISWLFYRPLLTVGLFIIIAVLIVAIKYMIKPQK